MSLTACTVLALAALIPAEPPKAQPQRAKWEYKVTQFDRHRYDVFDDKERGKTIDEINKLGTEGWECVTIVNELVGFMGPRTDQPVSAYFKRSDDVKARKNWEYSVVDARSKDEKKRLVDLTILSEKGWELACIVHRTNSAGGSLTEQISDVYLLKRSK